MSEDTRNLHRAIVSLCEELQAVDWYNQRAEACSDDELRAVISHNENEEIEHAMMNLEWIRRHSSAFDANIKKYLGSAGSIIAVESAGGEASRTTSTLTTARADLTAVASIAAWRPSRAKSATIRSTR